MLRKIIKPIIFLPLLLFNFSQQSISKETNNLSNEILGEKDNKIFLDYEAIEKIIINNQ